MDRYNNHVSRKAYQPLGYSIIGEPVGGEETPLTSCEIPTFSTYLTIRNKISLLLLYDDTDDFSFFQAVLSSFQHNQRFLKHIAEILRLEIYGTTG